MLFIMIVSVDAENRTAKTSEIKAAGSSPGLVFPGSVQTCTSALVLRLASLAGRSRHPRFESAKLDMSNQEF